MDSEESVRIIATALNEVKKKVSHIEKTGSNPHFKYDFVEEAHLIAEVRTALIEEGLIMSPRVVQTPQVFTNTGKGADQTTVVFVQEYMLCHTSGAIWPWPIAVVAAGQDHGDKHVWKASTGASKYALMRLLQLSTGDDPEADAAVDVQDEHSSAPQVRAKPPVKRGPRPQTGSRPGSSASVEDILSRYDEEANCDKQMLKDVGLYRSAFSKAEEIHGKPALEANDRLKFSVLDAALAQMGKDSPRQLQVKDIPPILDIIADIQDADLRT